MFAHVESFYAMIHPDTELRFIDEAIGYGVFATRKIPRGTITWALDKFDQTYSSLKAHGLEPIYRDILDMYSYRNSLGNMSSAGILAGMSTTVLIPIASQPATTSKSPSVILNLARSSPTTTDISISKSLLKEGPKMHNARLHTLMIYSPIMHYGTMSSEIASPLS